MDKQQQQDQEEYKKQQEIRRLENRKQELCSRAYFLRERANQEAIRRSSEAMMIASKIYFDEIKKINQDFGMVAADATQTG